MATSPILPFQPISPNTGSANPLTALTPAGTPNAAQPFGTLPTSAAPTQAFNPADGSHTVKGDFKDTYGAGVGTALADTLSGLGSNTSRAVTATNQGILDAAGRQTANIQATDAAHGISTDSSAHALAIGDFNSQVAQTIASTDAQMQLSEEDTLIKALMGEGEAHGGDVSGWDTFWNTIKGVGSTIGDLAGAFVGDPALGSQLTSMLPGGKATSHGAGGAIIDNLGGNELQQLASL